MADKQSGRPLAIHSDASKRRGRGNGFTALEREAIYNTYLTLKNKSAVARSHNTSYATVCKIVREYEASHTLQHLAAQQGEVERQLKARTMQIASDVLDSIKPEDLESGRLPLHDKDGKVVGYKEFGPSVVAKATTFGIFVDKMKVQQDMARAVGDDMNSGALMLPDTADQLMRAIKGRVASLQLVNVRFRDEHQDLTTRIDQALQVEAIEAADAKSDDINFDNP